ncbi:MAG: protein TolQ [Deltaproteobacteria bacterium]|nr:protein TolQ [Deltaproteobacteria bacterium]
MHVADTEVLGLIANAGLMVRLVLMVLLVFSMACWAIIITKTIQFRRARREDEAFVEYFWKTADLSKAFAKAKKLPNSPVGRTFRAAYLELSRIRQKTDEGASFGSPQSAVERCLRRSGDNEVDHMSQWLSFLATTGNTTPFIGLFGTVWGIMNAFHGIGLRGSANLAVVAPGISEALVATAAGLAAAIPAVIAYNHFMTRLKSLDSQLKGFSLEFMSIVEREILPFAR